MEAAEDKEGNRGTIKKEPQSHLVRIGNKVFRRNSKLLRKLNVEPETSRNQNKCQRDLEEGGYESETSSEESGQGDVSSNRDGSTSNEEVIDGEEEPRT